MADTTIHYQLGNLIAHNYQFLDQNANPIDLTTATSIQLLLHDPNGLAQGPATGSVTGTATFGNVTCNYTYMTTAGEWSWQFVAHLPGSTIYGARQNILLEANDT